jgi:5-deoxy-glucuronate isomerase
VHNFGTPAALDADKFIVCEVITPAGNWSSYPPHKHDTNVPGAESNLEEIYYYEAAVSRGLEQIAPATADPFALHRTYASDDRAIDEFRQVRTGDVALVPYGWHGPAVAAPGYDMYYLNVMAGPDPERVWNITDDPAHGWVRQAWASEPIDPRLPYEKESSR